MDVEAPLLLRFAVVIGGVSLVLGLVGAVLLLIHDDEMDPAYGPGLGARLVVLGAPSSADLQVDLSWTEGGIHERSAAIRLGTANASFLLPPAASDRSVLLEIRDRNADGEVLHEEELRVERGEVIVVDLAMREDDPE